MHSRYVFSFSMVIVFNSSDNKYHHYQQIIITSFEYYIELQSLMQNPLLNHRSEIDQALFFAIGREDYDTAHKLVLARANPNSIFQVDKGIFISSFNLFITKAAALGVSKGPTNNQYLSAMKLMKDLIRNSTLECKCLKQHKCPLYIALQAFKISEQEDIFSCKCDLVRDLIVAGASIKFQLKQDPKASKVLGKWALKWLDIAGIRSYLITRNCRYVQTKIQT